MSSELRSYFRNDARLERGRRLLAIDEASFRNAVVSRGSLLEIAVIADARLEKSLDILLQQHDCGYRRPRGISREVFVRSEGLISPEVCTLVENIGFVRNALAHDVFILSHDVDHQDEIVRFYLDLAYLGGDTRAEVASVIESLDNDHAIDPGEDALEGRDLLRASAIVAHRHLIQKIDRDRVVRDIDHAQTSE